MGVALASLETPPVTLIVFAQAMTVLGNPILAGVLLWLSTRVQTPRWIQVLAGVGFLVVLVLALRPAPVTPPERIEARMRMQAAEAVLSQAEHPAAVKAREWLERWAAEK